MLSYFSFGYLGQPVTVNASTQTESLERTSSTTQTVTPEPIRLGFIGWTTLFIFGGLIGFTTADLTAGSIKGFTKEKTWEETGEKYSVFTSAGELYVGVMSIGSGFAALAIAYYIIQRLNQYYAAHPELTTPTRPPTRPPVLLTPEEIQRSFETSVATLAGSTLGLSISIFTYTVINGFSKQKTATNENGEETKYTVITDDGALYMLGLTFGCGLLAAALAWYRKPICNQVVKFFSNGHSSETTPLISNNNINHSSRS